MGKVYGYARVSTKDQDLALQKDTLRKAGAEMVVEDIGSGTSLEGRLSLKMLRTFLREGDTLLVTRIDRLARSIADLSNLVRDLQSKGITLKATEQPIDTGSAAGKAFLDMLGVFAEFETNLRKERQMEGIAKAKADGVYTGRKPTIDPERIRELKATGMGPSDIAKTMGIGRASVYRALAEQAAETTA